MKRLRDVFGWSCVSSSNHLILSFWCWCFYHLSVSSVMDHLSVSSVMHVTIIIWSENLWYLYIFPSYDFLFLWLTRVLWDRFFNGDSIPDGCLWLVWNESFGSLLGPDGSKLHHWGKWSLLLSASCRGNAMGFILVAWATSFCDCRWFQFLLCKAALKLYHHDFDGSCHFSCGTSMCLAFFPWSIWRWLAYAIVTSLRCPRGPPLDGHIELWTTNHFPKPSSKCPPQLCQFSAVVGLTASNLSVWIGMRTFSLQRANIWTFIRVLYCLSPKQVWCLWWTSQYENDLKPKISNFISQIFCRQERAGYPRRCHWQHVGVRVG